MATKVTVGGIAFDVVTENQVVQSIRAALDRGDGGRVITPNIDIVRRAAEATGFIADATFVVADGMPLLWAANLAGTPLPERVTGSSLIWSLSNEVAEDQRSVYLIGGSSPEICGRAADILAETCPGLRVAGHISPPFGFEGTPFEAEMRAELIEAKPDIVYVGLGFPKQEHVIDRLRPDLPGTWFIGCGASIQFVAGELNRAPEWMRRSGLEWAHRLLSEPRRLAGRYLVHDLPFALRLLAAPMVLRASSAVRRRLR